MGVFDPGAGAVYGGPVLAGRRCLRTNECTISSNRRRLRRKSFDIIGDIIAQDPPGLPLCQPAARSHYQAGDPHHRWLRLAGYPVVFARRASALERRPEPALHALYRYHHALSGINKTLLAKFGGECRCYISDPRVVAEAKAQGMTRSMAAVDIAVAEGREGHLFSAMRPLRCFVCWSMTSRSTA